MKRIFAIGVMVSALSFAFLPGAAYATRRRPSPPPKTYQVTGPVLELTSDTIVVQKGKERWEVARDAGTKVTGDLKVGATVTIQYRMTAASVNVQAAKPAAGAKAPPKKP
jgi:hypothetical protein